MFSAPPEYRQSPENPENYLTKRKMNGIMGERTGEVVVGVIALIIIIGAILFIFYWEPTPAKTITVKPITIPRAEKVGENVGSKTGRFVGGFFKGLWKRD